MRNVIFVILSLFISGCASVRSNTSFFPEKTYMHDEINGADAYSRPIVKVDF